MALVSSTLASALENLTPTDSEAEAIQRLTDAFEEYWNGATVNAIALNPGSIAAGLSAFQSALSGMSAEGQGAAKIAAACSAFWAAQASAATTMWTTAPIVLVPPIVAPAALSGLQAALEAAFASNVAGSLSLADCCSAIASAIHTANLDGVINGSVPPAAPAPLPIL